MILSQFQWGAPTWMLPTAALTAILVGLLVWNYRRATPRPAAAWIAFVSKLLAILALSLCLLEPLRTGIRAKPGANLFAVLVDDSQSMRVDRGDTPTTTQLNQWLDPTSSVWHRRLAKEFDLRTYRFANRLDPLESAASVTFSETGSRLAHALSELAVRYRSRPLSGVLLMSDGNATDRLSTAREIAQWGFPIFPVLSEKPVEPRDLRLEHVSVSQSNFESSPTTVEAQVAATGLEDEVLVIRLLDPDGGLVKQRELPAPSDGRLLRQRFRFRPSSSEPSFYQLQVFLRRESRSFAEGQCGDEATLANNSQTVLVDRGGGPFRILYVGGRPNWEFKFLRRALQSEPEVELVGLLRIANKEPRFVFRDQTGIGSNNRLFEGFDNRDPEQSEQRDQAVFVRLGVDDSEELRSGFPQSADQLYAYDAIILDDVESNFFSPDQQLLLRRFVSQRGGGLLMLGGLSSFAHGQHDKTPLADVLPIYLNPIDGQIPTGPHRWELTRDGRLEPWVRLRLTESAEQERLQQMPAFELVSRAGGTKPGSTLLAEVRSADDESRPALVTQRFGRGRSAALLPGDLWRWSMSRQEEQPDDLPIFWRQTVRWLVADVPRRVEVQRNAVPSNPLQNQLEVRVRDAEFGPDDEASVRLTVTSPSGQTTPLTAEANDQEPGLYTATFFGRETGGYRVTAHVTTAEGDPLAARPTGWTAQPTAEEFRRVPTNRAFLQQLAKDSGGELVAPDQIESFIAELPQRKIAVTEPWTRPLWHHPAVFLFAIACLCVEWGLRRWKGLP